MLSSKLAPEIRELLEGLAAQGAPPLESLPVEQARQVAQSLKQMFGDPQTVGRVGNREIPTRAGTVRVRIYTPEGNGPFPGLVFLHGGGWVICDLDTHDTVCRALCRGAGAVVVSVDYRLAPEHKFPAALNDCLDATQWVASNTASLSIDPLRLAVGGDSAGATMATVIAGKARDAGGPPIALQVLVYPVTDMQNPTPSRQEFAEDHFLTSRLMEWFADLYFTNPADRTNPDASPAFIENLRGMPPALLITAECDPLRDEGEAYGKRLKESGVPVTVTRYDGMIHPFLNFMGVTTAAHKAIDEMAAAIREAAPAKRAAASG